MSAEIVCSDEDPTARPPTGSAHVRFARSCLNESPSETKTDVKSYNKPNFIRCLMAQRCSESIKPYSGKIFFLKVFGLLRANFSAFAELTSFMIPFSAVHRNRVRCGEVQ